jgi:hypothetical protein
MAGAVEHGLFIGMASIVLVALGHEVKELHCEQPCAMRNNAVGSIVDAG